MGLEWDIRGSDGRKFNSLGDMIQAEGDALITNHVESIEEAIRAETCSVHGGHPKVAVKRTGDQYSYEIEACCDDLKDRALAAAERAHQS